MLADTLSLDPHHQWQVDVSFSGQTAHYTPDTLGAIVYNCLLYHLGKHPADQKVCNELADDVLASIMNDAWDAIYGLNAYYEQPE